MKPMICLAVTLFSIALALPAGAQSGPPGAGNAIQSSGAQPIGNHLGQNNMTQDQFNQLSEYVDQAHRLSKDDKAKGKTEADLKAEDKAAAADIAKTLSLPCDVTDAELVVRSSPGKDGKGATMSGYETACGGGMGYFLVSQAPQNAYGVSCFTAQARHELDATKGKTDDAVCRLPANADVNAMAGRLLGQFGATCAVQKLAWMGQSDITHAEYNEAACADGKGYVLVTALPGAQAQAHAISCADAAQQGLACKLTSVPKSAEPVVTLQTFKDALAAHKVACDIGGERVIGRENVQKRYVVEFVCAQQPKGLVAFIPVGAVTAPFETTDCAVAAKRGLACKLNAGQ
jgi:hypothetical protein